MKIQGDVGLLIDNGVEKPLQTRKFFRQPIVGVCGTDVE
jgi:hypothetical protein